MKIAMLLSGGVDSAVATHLLVEQGYRPDCFYIKIGMNDRDNDLTCTMEEDIEMASAIAHKYNLKFEIVDLQNEYWDNVVKYTIDKVRAGLTPNPDVMCNKYIKFGAFYNKIGYQYDKIATGHYAQIVENNKGVFLGTTPDTIKDQTDFLCQLSYEQLQRAIFPIGKYTKAEVRKIAEDNHLVNAKRKDSQGICFLGKINYKDFLKKYVGVLNGDVIDIDNNKVIGTHEGAYLYTIGQRKGLGIGGGDPFFVCKKDISKNIVYVTRDANYQSRIEKKTSFKLKDVNWLLPNHFDVFHRCPTYVVLFKIRHSAEVYKGILSYDEANKEYTVFYGDLNLGSVAEGQFCVLYDKNICIGSGEIC